MRKLHKRGVESIWIILMIVLVFIVLVVVGQIIKNIIDKATAT